MSKYIALDQHTNSTGAIVHWRLCDHVSADKLASLIDAQPMLREVTGAPATPSPEVALNRAMETVRAKRLLARRIKLGTWGIVRESVDKAAERLSHAHELTVAVDAAGIVRASDTQHELAQIVLDAYNTALTELSSNDISAWLTDLVAKFGAVALRASGGLYYLPPAALQLVRELRSALNGVDARLYEIPATSSDDVVANVLDGLADEVETVAIAAIANIEDVGPRARVTRKSKLNDMLLKLRKYEQLLGVALPKLHERAELATAAIVAAEMTDRAA